MHVMGGAHEDVETRAASVRQVSVRPAVTHEVIERFDVQVVQPFLNVKYSQIRLWCKLKQ